ncbi:hypothetical protein Cob_v002088 [Colletotrichum orbiculare MAFF 240422]|uniref:Uncharacterized protein n=1 Tax=Colletotrichum orbiculare (strain 104-T / ATCC 96160 / CBS 514.97 / LARS 414 / MAFF 240422) TaxID=1213857 RepID=A0A484G2Y0_COLOR|nr:hypothetical protein Cob_v002088 [Colletotrichum orbiculare MAFF 240422]
MYRYFLLLERLFGWLESRCVTLLADIHKSVPQIGVIMWPARLTPGQALEEGKRSGFQYLTDKEAIFNPQPLIRRLEGDYISPDH